ncbi:unnamed protein product [Moneuplotes crassus]|uniref:Uncharacterized protein n=1 Tax=Euplotes crassus TaxID=5936 RepID=A0AAD1XLJ5_EUPCR|nr:unnamed protein product [Moneuplotes crassus]
MEGSHKSNFINSILSKVDQKQLVSTKEHSKLYDYFEQDYFQKTRYAYTTTVLSVPAKNLEISVVSDQDNPEEQQGSFLEAIKKYYNYVKYIYGSQGSDLYYRFDFYRTKVSSVEYEESKEQINPNELFKVGMKFYCNRNKSPNFETLFAKRNMVIISVDPRDEASLALVNTCSKVLETKAIDIARNDPIFPEILLPKDYYEQYYRKMVKIVVNRCDSSHRIVGTNKLLRTAIKYGFGIVELSSETGVNLDFLMNHLIEVLIPEEAVEKIETIDVKDNYQNKEMKGVLERLKEKYGDTIEIIT